MPMKRFLTLLTLIAVLPCGAQSQTGAPTQETRARLESWSICQREFITPLLESRQPVSEVVTDAHEACAREEEALRQALVREHGPAQAGSLMTMMKEATDRIMCGLLRAVRQSGDGTMTFNTAEECLRGDVQASSENRAGAESLLPSSRNPTLSEMTSESVLDAYGGALHI